MLRLLQNALLSTLIVTTSVSTSYAASMGISADAGRYLFRYKVPETYSDNPDPSQEKDITAFYVAAVGVPFSEVLPMKPEWQDDTWVVSGGTLPDGVSFDGATATFSGSPRADGKGVSVDLVGYNSKGEQEATASATFDVYAVAGQVYNIDFYAHTGKYHFEQLPLPSGVAIQSWNNVYQPPAGVSVVGRNLDGTPTKAGQYRIFMQGLDFLGNIVATYVGKYTVEDGPTFTHIADDIQRLPQQEFNPLGLGPVNFGAPSPYHVVHQIDPAKPVRYLLEVKDGNNLPQGISSNDNATDLRLVGFIARPYDQSTIRFKAIDSDGTIGYSNWFTFGSSDPQPGCSLASSYPVSLVTGRPADVPLAVPNGAQGELHYFLDSGILPSGISLAELTGHLKGTPTKAETQDVGVRVDVVNGGSTVSTSCKYSLQVRNGSVWLNDTTQKQAQHIRIGDPYSGTVTVSGGIPHFTTEFAAGQDLGSLSIAGDTTDQASVTISGTLASKALPLTANITVHNGDGHDVNGSIHVYAHPPLAFGQTADVAVQRLSASKILATVPYDPDSVVPDVTGATDYPVITLSPSSGLPSGISFDGRRLVGTTAAEEGTYGPFTATMRDFTGQTAASAPFNVVVSPRAPITAKSLAAPAFTVENPVAQTATPFAVEQPDGGKDFAISWSISGSLPDWLHFDTASGKLTADANVPFAQIGNYGPFTITATDSENSAVTSADFSVTAKDWDQPQAMDLGKVKGTVGGRNPGETPTQLSITGLTANIVESTVIGGRQAVKFLSSEPAQPAGLTFDTQTGSFSGEPQDEFNGIAVVTFSDARDRTGTINVPMEVRPYPTVSMSASNYDLPRLSQASATIPAPSTGSGFWSAPTWSLDAGTLPTGLSVDAATGLISGKTSLPVGNVASGLRLKATSKGANGENLASFTGYFSIQVAAQTSMKLSYAPAADTFYLKDRTQTTDYTVVNHSAATPAIAGSAVSPLSYRIIPGDTTLPDGLGINPATGVITWTATPRLGTWPFTVEVTDAEGNDATADLSVKSTLAGNIVSGIGDASYRLRVGQPFKSNPVSATNVVGSAIYSTTPSLLPQSLDFSGVTGAFSEESYFDAAGPTTVKIGATDDDGRTMVPSVILGFDVAPPLSLTLAQTSFDGKQYDPAVPLSVAFQRPVNLLGKPSYSIVGTVPGTLVTKVYDNGGTLLRYDWLDTSGTPQSATPDLTSTLPSDALVFDPATLTLTGVPSASGSFPLTLTATDDWKDSYIRDVPTRTSSNRASIGFTANVAPGAVLSASNATSGGASNAETLYQYTSQPTLVTTASNNAFGKAVQWAKTAGTLPTGLGATTGDTAVAFSGYPEATGTFGGIVYKATDAAGRNASAAAVTFTVQPRLPLQLVASSNPKGMTVNVSDADLTVSAKNTAYGLPIAAGSWTVTGVSNLPPGVTYTVADGGVHFTGVPTVIGTYTNVMVGATDTKGGTASVNLTFKVLSPSDAIGLTVANITTKVGHSFSMQAIATNTYGGVRFYSNDIPANLASQIAVSQSGVVSGTLAATQQTTINVVVTDESTRVTSKAVTLNVIPNLQVVVPTLIATTQGATLAQVVDTFNKAGTVTYTKGAGTWPTGLSVNATTGAITGSVSASAGTYANLTITATDTFGAETDTQSSNAFSIRIDPIAALPTIDSPSNNKWSVGTVGSAFTTFTSVVRDNVSNKPWPGPLTFTANHDIAADTGLTFDSTKGIISGTPTKPVIYTDLVITATTDRGDKASTQPFWFGVQPSTPIVASAGQKTSYVVRVGKPYATDPVSFDNAFGKLTFAIPAGIGPNQFNTANGVYSNPMLAANQAGHWPTTVTVTDGFGRTGSFTYNLDVYAALTASVPAPIAAIAPGTAVSGVQPVTTTNAVGPLTFSLSGAPSGLTISPTTGALSGTISNSVGIVTVTVTVTDAADGSSVQLSYQIDTSAITGHTYWRIADKTPVTGAGCDAAYSGATLHFNVTQWVTTSGVDVSNTKINGGVLAWIPDVWAISAGGNGYETVRADVAGLYFKVWKFSSPVDIGKIGMYDTSGFYGCTYKNPTVDYSDDGVNWTTSWSKTGMAPVNGWTYLVKP